MSHDVKNQILKAVRQMLGGIIRLSMRNGVSFLEFSELSKSLHVEIAAKEYGVWGRETNDSRIALITGLDRRDIKKVRKKAHDVEDDQTAEPTGRMPKILTAWHQDPKYTDDNQQPLELSIDAEENSFTQLINEYGGDIAVVTVLREFKRSKTVEETEQGKLRVLKRFFIPNYLSDPDSTPDYVDPASITFGSSMLVDHINTVFFNLYRHETNRSERMELRATNTSVAKSKVSDFYNFADDLSMEYLTKIDDWLAANEVDDTEPSERLGVGLYFIEGQNNTVED